MKDTSEAEFWEIKMKQNKLKQVYGGIILNSLDTHITDCKELTEAKSVFKIKVNALEGFCDYILLTKNEISELLKEYKKNNPEQLRGENVIVYYIGSFIGGLQKN